MEKLDAEVIADDFRQVIGKMLIDSMMAETNSKNMEVLVWLLCGR